MASERNLIVPKKIKDKLQTDFIGQEIYSFTEVTSTNDVAKELAIKGAKEGTIVIAETQSRGRGRLDRKWVSPEGGIWFSIILRPKVDPRDALRLTLMATAVVAKVITDMFRLEVEVKWPNDVLIKGRKVCGILAEMRTEGCVVDFVAIGVGVNANIDLDSVPAHLRGSVTSLKEELKGEVGREGFLRALLEELEHYYKLFTRKRYDPILEEWKSLTSLLGSYVEITDFSEKIEGWVVDVDQSGALIIKLRDGTIKKVTSGDVTYKTSVR